MSGWYWTKFWWGMLLIPVMVVVITLVEGGPVRFGFPLLAFVVVWMVSVVLAMRKLGVPPFSKGDD